MWICEKCGESHTNQFRECWKCVGAAETEQVSAEPLPPAEPAPPLERPLRSSASILVRTLVGFVVGTLMGTAIFHRSGTTLRDAAIAGVVVGAVLGMAVGTFFWVLFPFEPAVGAQDKGAEKSDPIG